MDMFISILIAVCFFTSGSTSESDPCTSYEPLPRAEYRGGQCGYDTDKAVCDVYLNDATWYQAQGLNGYLTIQNSSADFATCGTKFPIWMNGPHPTIAEGEVDRQGCKASLTSACTKTVTIRVKNCGDFYVYKMPRTGSCPEAYCFGETEPCPPFDPCDFYEHTPIEYDATRSTSCDVSDVSSCDSLDSNTWYKFRGKKNSEYLTVASSCPTGTTCGTRYPMWIHGPLFDLPDDTGISAGCVQSGDYCCAQLFRVDTKQCRGFTVYRFLDNMDGQCRRYCTDDPSSVCAVPTTGPTAGSSSTSQSTIKSTTTDEASSTSQSSMTTADTARNQGLLGENTDEEWLVPVIIAGGAALVVGLVLGVAISCVIGKIRGKRDSENRENSSEEKNTYYDATSTAKEDQDIHPYADLGNLDPSFEGKHP